MKIALQGCKSDILQYLYNNVQTKECHEHLITSKHFYLFKNMEPTFKHLKLASFQFL
jgi:hypothetical protein